MKAQLVFSLLLIKKSEEGKFLRKISTTKEQDPKLQPNR